MKSIFIKQLAVTSTILLVALFYLKERYYIGIDQQDQPCLYAKVFLVDTWASPEDFEQGDLMAYWYHHDGTLMPKGTVLVKIVAAGPDQEVRFNSFHVSTNSRQFKADISSELKRLGVEMPEQVKLSTKQDEYFLVGETAYSYDSRYWGPAKANHIVGKAYAIL